MPVARAGESLGPLLGRLRETARADIDGRLAAARADAQRVIDSARERLAEQQASALRRRREELERDRDRRLHEARDAAARTTLAAGEALVDKVLRAVLRDAARSDGWPGTADWLRNTLTSALEFLPPGPFVLRTRHPAAVELARRVAPGREAQVTPSDSSLGVLVETPDGRLVVNATLERFLQAERPRLAQAIVRLALEGTA